MPQVSVIIPSYNHEAFIEECIESVLQQTFQDFEIIITDDGSKDGTAAKIETFTDPRIKLFRHSENKGACVAANNCLKHSQGRYIANLSSDDVWMPEKLEVQVDYLDSHSEIAAVFGKVVWIDEDSDPIIDPEFPYQHVFDVHNRSRYEWLNHFFYGGNCLCHPCSLVRRKCYDEVGWFNPTMASLPDFDLWVRLCLQHDIYILDQKLIKFRRLRHEKNASGDTESNHFRIRFESRRIMDHFFKINNVEEFLRVFPEAKCYGDICAADIPYILGHLAIHTGLDNKILWGLDNIYNQLQDIDNAERIYEKFGFSYLDFIKLTGNYDVFGISLIAQQSFNFTNAHNEVGYLHKQIQPKHITVTERIKRFLRRRYIKSEIKILEDSNYFDSDWYLTTNPDVAAAKIDPIRHYLLYGGFEGRDPSTKFSSMWYLNTYEDVKAAGINPLIHYLSYGKSEGRKPKE